ncbi:MULTISPECIES: hypothetical protein [Caldimonas]|uniref:hypothetical protein n=1 Tax=Caldimonas TaxID=196013 RepID=UPI0003793951|nr:MULTISPECIES: hypothetical protein [Caldimonas]MCX7659077.1 hypothetical protein [Caldimonas manganoxidans]GIX25170.1 MAG: hypothetical protein KatS3mg122_2401 [Caldimonas sp.]
MPRSLHRRAPLRLWMTGCVAVVMAALSSPLARGKTEDAVDRPGRHALVSPYDVDETVSKIEAAASSHGLVVFAKRIPPECPGATLVLGLSGGVTPVVMDDGSREIELPWQIDVVRASDGRTEVRFHDPWPWSDMVADAPPDALRAIGPLPALLQSALG